MIVRKAELAAAAEDDRERLSSHAMSAAGTRPPRPARPALPPLHTFESLDETHRQIIDGLGQLDSLLALLTQPGEETRATALAARICRFFGTIARDHHELEETRVFPSLLEGANAGWRAHVQRLQQDHDWLEEDWMELEPHLQAIANGYRGDHLEFLREALPGFNALYHEHIALEESLVYPEAKRRAAARDTTA